MNNPQPHDEASQDMNRAAHARLARLTYGLSPVSITNAYTDWLAHLARKASRTDGQGIPSNGTPEPAGPRRRR